MRILLRTEFPNGWFGDPALLVWELNEKSALLVDCGDLSRFQPKQLLKVKSIFLSHCHMDHFFGFDLFLRIHMGKEKTTTIFGPPETSDRVAGKLQGYTWNLITDQKLEFVVVDLDPSSEKKTTTRFRAQDQFRPSSRMIEAWNPQNPILDEGTYRVHSILLDHRTPSLAYSIEEKMTLLVNLEEIKKRNYETGPWINELKNHYLSGSPLETSLQIPLATGTVETLSVGHLAKLLLIPKQRHKIVYVTDGAAHQANREKLIPFIEKADLLYHESCFLRSDQTLADETKHFTAGFVGEIAQEAQVKKLVPFHFSKRYLDFPMKVLDEVGVHFKGEIVNLAESSKDLIF